MKFEKSLLIVDDEARIRSIIGHYFAEKGYIVHQADNGQQACEIFKKEKIALVLLDLMLPDITGEKLCLDLRQQSRVPIIILSARSSDEDIVTGLEYGADDYVTKPFSLRALYARAETVIRRASDDLIALYSKNSFNNDDLEIDFSQFTVKKQQKKVNLTAIEFQVLSGLVKFPTKVFTREELISTIFGNTYKGYNRTIDSHIKNIRAKIETDAKNPVYIKTVHGVGYKFGGE